MLRKAHSREKGRRGEHEFEMLAQARLGDAAVFRNFDQARAGGTDVILAGRIYVQVKRGEKPKIGTWWKQACEEAGEQHIPALAWRKNFSPWRFFIRIGELDSTIICDQGDKWLVQMGEEAFFHWVLGIAKTGKESQCGGSEC